MPTTYIWFEDKYGYHSERKVVHEGYTETRSRYVSFDRIVWC